MPIDSTPDGQGILNKPVVKPFPKPTPSDNSEESENRARRDDETSADSLVNPGTEEPAETNRPPLGN